MLSKKVRSSQQFGRVEHLGKFIFLNLCGFTLNCFSLVCPFLLLHQFHQINIYILSNILTILKHLFNRKRNANMCVFIKTASPAFIEMPSLTQCVLLANCAAFHSFVFQSYHLADFLTRKRAKLWKGRCDIQKF